MLAASPPEPWAVTAEDYPHAGSDADQLAFAVRYAVLAPSSHNAQPWRFNVRRQWLELVADRSRSLPVSDPQDRELTIGCGAALFHLRTAIEHFGRVPVVHLLPDSDDADLLATVRLGEPAKPCDELERLFFAIPRRRTNRSPFDRVALPRTLVADLGVLVATHGVRFIPLFNGPKESLATLIDQGDHLQMHAVSFREELASWLRPNRDDIVDGMPGSALGLSDARSRLEPLLVRTLERGGARATRDHELAAGAPILAVLGTPGDTPRAWLAAGEALAHLLLHACAEGVSASFLNQPIEVPRLRLSVAQLLDEDMVPQLVLRLGYGPETLPTPRRPLWQLLHRFD